MEMIAGNHIGEEKKGSAMTEKEKKIFETFGEVIPKLSESDKSYLLGLGEGMAIKIEQSAKPDNTEKELTA